MLLCGKSSGILDFYDSEEVQVGFIMLISNNYNVHWKKIIEDPEIALVACSCDYESSYPTSSDSFAIAMNMNSNAAYLLRIDFSDGSLSA